MADSIKVVPKDVQKKELKKTLYESVFRLVTDQQLYLMSQARPFSRINDNAKVAVSMWLERAQRRIYYRCVCLALVSFSFVHFFSKRETGGK